ALRPRSPAPNRPAESTEPRTDPTRYRWRRHRYFSEADLGRRDKLPRARASRLRVGDDEVDEHSRNAERAADTEREKRLTGECVLGVHESAHREQCLDGAMFGVLLDGAECLGEVVDGLVRDHVAEIEKPLGGRPTDVARVQRHAEVDAASDERRAS